jgi:hypothetical protein
MTMLLAAGSAVPVAPAAAAGASKGKAADASKQVSAPAWLLLLQGLTLNHGRLLRRHYDHWHSASAAGIGGSLMQKPNQTASLPSARVSMAREPLSTVHILWHFLVCL